MPSNNLNWFLFFSSPWNNANAISFLDVRQPRRVRVERASDLYQLIVLLRINRAEKEAILRFRVKLNAKEMEMGKRWRQKEREKGNENNGIEKPYNWNKLDRCVWRVAESTPLVHFIPILFSKAYIYFDCCSRTRHSFIYVLLPLCNSVRDL